MTMRFFRPNDSSSLERNNPSIDLPLLETEYETLFLFTPRGRELTKLANQQTPI
jgi:hypothetical protein